MRRANINCGALCMRAWTGCRCVWWRYCCCGVSNSEHPVGRQNSGERRSNTFWWGGGRDTESFHHRCRCSCPNDDGWRARDSMNMPSPILYHKYVCFWVWNMTNTDDIMRAIGAMYTRTRTPVFRPILPYSRTPVPSSSRPLVHVSLSLFFFL